jgi:hypothetical protein
MSEETASVESTNTSESATPEVASTESTQSAPEMDWMASLDKALTGIQSPKPNSEVTEEATVEETETEAAQESEPESNSEADDSVDEVPKSMTRSAGAKFKELKSELKDWKTKYAELEKVLEEAGSKPPEDYEALKTKVAEYEKELSVTRVEATEQYKQAVVAPLNNVLTAAYSLADKYGVEEATLQAALAETNIDKQSEMLQDLASSFSERDRLGLYRMADDVALLLKRKEEIKANAQSAYSTLSEQQKKEATEARTKALSSVYSTLSEKIPLLQNKDIASKVKSIADSTDILSSKPDVQAYATYAGALLPHLVKEYQSQSSKIAELEKTIASFRKTVPKAGGGKQTATKNLNSDVGFLEALESHL